MKKLFDTLQDQMVENLKRKPSPKENALTIGISVIVVIFTGWLVFTGIQKQDADARNAAEIHRQLSAIEAEAKVRLKVGDAVGAIELIGKLSHPSESVYRRIEGDGMFEESRTVSYQEHWDSRRDSLLKVVTDL